MKETGDHALEAFAGRKDPAKLGAYMTRVETEAQERRKLKRRKQPQKSATRPSNSKARKGRKLISIQLPESAKAGESITLVIPHKLNADQGEQSIHVTLKDGNQKRLERKVLKISGEGELKVTFDVPTDVAGGALRFAAFVGVDYSRNLQHVTAGPLSLK